MIFRGPTVHIETDLGDQLECAIGANARKLGEIDPSTEFEQGGADLERRRVVLGLFLGARPSRSRQLPRWRLAGGLERVDANLDLLVTAMDLLLVEVVHLELLAKYEEVLIAIVTRERGGDLLFGRLAPRVAMTSQHRGIGLASHDVAKDQHPGDPSHIADHLVKLEVHQRQRLLHPLDTGGRLLHEFVPVPHQSADRRDFRVGPKASA